ncbi:MAG TPA: beta-L-arabinofuranosidase domain-containing protein [bacterium]|nr:beta-L-arabinofuranosidase domain-containing protein [bacterium]
MRSRFAIIIAGILSIVIVCTDYPGNLLAAPGESDKIIIQGTLKIDEQNDFYVSARDPMVPEQLIKLPVGTIEPRGWVRSQLKLMADGFTGHLTELSRWCTLENNAWTSPDGRGEHGWEEVPYWLKGFTSLGYILEDDRIIREAEKWIAGVLQNQAESGFFGPRANWETAQVSHTTAHDIWPNMVMLYVLRTYYERTGDERVIEHMRDYFQWQTTVPLDLFLMGTWQRWRGGDNLDHILWLYKHTGEQWLLDLAYVNHDQTADWDDGIPTWHGVNISQAYDEPALFYSVFGDERYLDATIRNYNTVMDRYGQVPGGMFGADENAREGHTGPRQAAETCSMVEMMFSHETMAAITGDPIWADRTEEVAFNSLPAAMTPDLKGLHYLTAPNMVQLDTANKAPMLQNGGNMLGYSPWRYRCCQHNVSHGWPYYAERLWMATRGNGIAAVFYADSKVTATVGSGTDVTLNEQTNYPFDDRVEIHLSMDQPTEFPLVLRIPGWTDTPVVRVNGNRIDQPVPGESWIRIHREWQNGDEVTLEFPMKISVKRWDKNKDAVSVMRGPLTYSLKVREQWEQYGGTEEWPAYQVFPASPWNYGLVIDAQDPGANFEVTKKSETLAEQPFDVENSPIEITARAKRIPGWRLEENGLIGEIPQSPVESTEPTEEVMLIPMGCARLRVSAFPVVK